MISHSLPLLTSYKMLNRPAVSDISPGTCKNSHFPKTRMDSVKSGFCKYKWIVKRNFSGFSKIINPRSQEDSPNFLVISSPWENNVSYRLLENPHRDGKIQIFGTAIMFFFDTRQNHLRYVLHIVAGNSNTKIYA